MKGRIAGALALAAVATIVAALIAVPLNESSSRGAPDRSTAAGLASGPSAAAGSSPAIPSPGATLLPARLSDGRPLGVRHVPVRLDNGYQADNGYRMLDLDRGELTAVLARFPTHAKLLALPAGRLLCACTTPVGGWASATAARVEIRVFQPDGRLVKRIRVGTYVGSREGWDPDNGPPFDTTAGLNADGRFLFLSWIGRRATGWRSGIDVVDLANGRVVQRLRLPDHPLLIGRATAFPWLPTVEVSPGDRMVITRGVVSGGSLATERWSARFGSGRIEGLAPFASGPGTVDECAQEFEWEVATDDVYVGICSTALGLVVRRVRLDGRPLGDTAVPDLLRNEGWQSGHVVDRQGQSYIVWDASTLHVYRIDLASGAIAASAVLSEPVGAGADSPLGLLGSLGRWLAPSVAAKIPYGGSLTLSPDGRRLFALAGTIWVLDPRTLEVLDRWQPAAELIGIALSRDGQLLFAEGIAGFDADGSRRPEQGASLTIYDAASGSIRLLLGQLGDGWLGLEPTLMP